MTENDKITDNEEDIREDIQSDETLAEGNDIASDEAENNEAASDVEKEDEEIDENVKWYAVRIISGHEKKVKAYLDNEIKLEGLGTKIKNVILPLEKVYEVKNGKKRVKTKNFLPGYIIIEANLDEQVRGFISKSPSILNMVGSKGIKGEKLQPIALKPAEVKRINSILNEESQNERVDLRLSVGDPVKVISGPFNNFNGNVLEINNEKMKVKVMVSIFGRKTPIELEFTQIEKEK